MIEETFYNLLNSILELHDNKTQDFLDNYKNFLDSLLYNQELINDVKKQMRLEGISQNDMVSKKEQLLEDMRTLADHMELNEYKKEMYSKMIEIVSKIYALILKPFGRFIPFYMLNPFTINLFR